MKVYDSENLCYVDSGLACDTFNIIHIDGNNLSNHELEKALVHFDQRKFPYCIWIHQEKLSLAVKEIFKNNNLTEQNQEVGMALNLREYSPEKKELHANVKVVNSQVMINDYAKVIAENWTPADINVLRYYELTALKYLEDDKITLLAYYQDQKPVSTVELFASDEETIGLYGFATLEAYRGQGIGSTLMTFALNRAKAMGYKTAILQASEDGLGIYRRYGFKEITTYYEYA